MYRNMLVLAYLRHLGLVCFFKADETLLCTGVCLRVVPVGECRPKGGEAMASRQSYKTLIQDPRWQRKRLSVLSRANWHCEWCGVGDKSLQVHHGFYGKTGGQLREPWKVPEEVLWVLCDSCHERAEVARQSLYLEIGRIHPRHHFHVRQLLQQVQEAIARNPSSLQDAAIVGEGGPEEQ